MHGEAADWSLWLWALSNTSVSHDGTSVVPQREAQGGLAPKVWHNAKETTGIHAISDKGVYVHSER